MSAPAGFKSIRVGDLVVVGARTWCVIGVYLGALGQESMVGLLPLDKTVGRCGGANIAEMLTPHDLIPHNAIHRRVDHEACADLPPTPASSEASYPFRKISVQVGEGQGRP